MNRRTFLTLASAVAASATLQACAPAAQRFPNAPHPLNFATPPPRHLAHFAPLSRLTFGPRLAEREYAAQIGLHAWVEEQLDYANVEDSSAEIRLRPYDAIRLSADELEGWHKPDAIKQFKTATLLSRIYSRRQLYENMVEFWTDHFNISIRKNSVWSLKIVDQRDVIRKHALGNFRDLLHASAKSPAMLLYLDNQANHRDAPNENYAREVMELHTLGVNGGYTQNDVMELARCLTGWSIKEHFWYGQFSFNPDHHDDQPKTVLGRKIAPAGIHEAESVLDQLASHPSTARHIVTKLIRRFICDDPERDSAELLNTATQTFLDTQGDIKAVLKMVLHNGLIDRQTPLPPKFKRPTHFLIGSLRMTNTQTNANAALSRLQADMGQTDYEWPTPDGPPDYTAAWRNNLFPRWKFALDLALDKLPKTTIGLAPLITQAPDPQSLLATLSNLLLGHPIPPNQLTTQQLDQLPPAIITAGLLASPAYQWK